ncbi:DNA gyrase subunit A [Solibaculum mannosilyticum]|uniref:DNA gyrase subunit A n=1 Tax=Solibaculum mannosilyticum TaxID=2780922 RepID=A0A7I8CY29_9FIRM|nr:DNA gyrase subunit A [Solibaculum mannosilyticum]BCI59371.1 DNA gyrase subunit A [Solibaculum mannosilyticum]
MNKVIQVDIEKEMRKSYLDYSMSVIVSRALPDVRDGLKPVHRRILYTMHENSLWPDRAYRKCADTVGAVLGRYHPHGDASVYDALVRMAQDFSMRYILVDGHGNFGSVDGDPPAAYRYTEARMSKIATEMLTDIEKDTVDFTSNYDDRLKEPQVLPSRFPNLLVNGSTGIAVGMATNMPPHNLGEVIDAICLLIENPDATLNELMEYIQGPDFPTGGIIMGRSGIRAAYGTGRGRILVRAKADIVESHNGRFQIVVTELPYQVNKARLVQSIAELIKEKRIDGLQNVDDHSDREGMRIVMDLKREANPQVVLNQLFTYTQMQVTFGVINLALANGQPKVLTLKELLEHYIQFQLEVITRRTQFDLRKAQERAHILEALCKALDFIDEVVSILRSSKSIPEGKQNLMDRFEFDEIQATAIVQMTLGRLTGLEREKLEGELEELEIKIANFKDILASEERRLNIVREEVCVLRDKYNNPRRTHITAISGEVDIEDLIEEEECVLTLTRFGYIKRLPVDTYRTQRRGGRGISGMTQREEDYVDEMFVCSTHDTVMFFTNIGRVYRLKGYEVPEGSRTSKGLNMANLLPLSQGERVNAMIRVTGDDKGYIVMVTRQGIIKRCDLSLFGNVRKNGIIALELNEGDELAWVRLTSGENRLIVATKGGMAIRFDENDVRPMGRAARGVKAIHLAEGDEVVGMARTREGGTLLTVTETGYGRRSQISDYRLQTRGGKGIINYRTSLYGKVAGIKVVDEDDDVMMIASNGIIIRVAVSDISIYARPAKGVRVMRIDPDSGDRLVTLARTPHEDDEETQPVEDEPQEASDLEEEAESADSVQEDETAGESQEP